MKVEISMDRGKHLILIKGEDCTDDIKFCEYSLSTQKYIVVFKGNEKTYSYNYTFIEWVKNPEVINPDNVRIKYKDQKLDKIQTISVFHARATDYWFIRLSNGSEKTYNSQEINISYSCLGENETKKCLKYLQALASIHDLKSDDGEILLQKQYENLKFVGEDTVMAVYMNPKRHKMRIYQVNDYIFPFGGNSSQFKAVTNALSNQVSIIQGPPGTGKTQTILNIIANLLIIGKSVQIVSNNNSATLNVLEKLSSPLYELGFLVAPLGKSKNKVEFINSQTGIYPTLTNWKLNVEQQFDLKTKINNHVKKLSSAFSVKERLAQAKAELNSLIVEIKYFEQYCSETYLTFEKIKYGHNLTSKKVMLFWQECHKFLEKEREITFWFKIKCVFIYRFFGWKIFRNDISTIITFFQRMFYHLKQSELSNEIIMLENQLTAMDTNAKITELTNWSMDYLRAKLFERYGDKSKRIQFSEYDLRRSTSKIVKEYPIILSTTFSSCNSLIGEKYDYLIMDEASQVDVATGALALSCAKNAVIVGDLKQLPNVITNDMKKKCDTIFKSYNLPQGYSFSENSFLKSVCSILPNAPQSLLREHYRCHPKIIGFCNQKFYDNKLTIMTEDFGEPDTLTFFKTVVGDLKRDHINQRQIDVTIQEALPLLRNVNPQDVGIIAPYRSQVSAIKQQLESNLIEVDTVHKFQGREKDTILLTTVDDVVTGFSDDPYLLNVAISRAKKQLILVVSGNEQPENSIIGDLISYIEYNNYKIIKSEIRSIFDLLYRQYTDARIAFLKKHPSISVYASENLMYGTIVNILRSDRYSNLSLNIICHHPLNMLIRDPKLLSNKELKYAINPATHIDFLLYNQVSKKPVLVIEVDGFHHHKPGTRQYERDRLKDHILELYEIPLLRFPTNGSEECARIELFLDEYADKR
jgi:superfamily I DNA and/or RNA helicase